MFSSGDKWYSKVAPPLIASVLSHADGLESRPRVLKSNNAAGKYSVAGKTRAISVSSFEVGGKDGLSIR